MPQLCVLMPVRDGAKWIGASIESVLAQTFDDLELIIVDDGSVDATPQIVAGHAARDARIVTITQPASGLVTALNIGLARARAPLLARLDADDIAEPTRMAEQIAAMTANPRLSLLGSWAAAIDDAGRRCGVRHPRADAEPLMREVNSANPMIHSTVMMRTGLTRQVGGYRHAFVAAEDFDLWLRLSEIGEVANLERELVRYRVHANSVSARKALVQMFSTRLAQRSAKLRRAQQPDPADGMQLPFDLWSEPPAPYAEDFAVFRLLAWVNPDTIPQPFRDMPPDFSQLTRAALSRRECRYAQRAILRYLADNRSTMRPDLWWRLIALRPLRAVRLIWQYMIGAKHGLDD